MPIYEWACNDEACGDLTETIVPLAQKDISPSCPTCYGSMHRVMLPSTVRATHCDAILLFKTADGEYKFPGRNDAPTPAGCTRLELQPAEARRVLRDINRIERRKIEAATEAEHRYLEEIQAQHRPDLLHAMRSMPERWRAFAQLAIDTNNRKPLPRSGDPNVHIEALEYDAGNREGWADQDRHGRRRK